MKKLVVLTGAGMSAESGLSTFRSSDGLWENHRVEDVATPEGWERDPEAVLDFYNMLRRKLITANPNEGHCGLATLEREYEVRIITQNVDNLHERAGSGHVLHLHGELMKSRSSGDENLIYDIPVNNPDIKIGDKCAKGYQLRPHIVWFGEAVPMIEKAIDWVAEADIFVVIGTSLNVYPAAGLLHYVRRGVPVYLIDPNEVHAPGNITRVIRKGATEGVKELTALLKQSHS
ncbi:SIR2 family NAD-dependent protein deacylase [Coprobacter tertius]|uniref:NAD-dependent protein deacylase n=1 Tax=Coprobacter tertius TaxID=2944915 RepID=A0ABT1MEC1_9BACT|nr:NAD-dependent deacylase [Coprobacter tertius]MCP9610726.1 NAD-dependent deacylase [Coprobacter tertius]